MPVQMKTIITLLLIGSISSLDWSTNTECPNINMDLWTGGCKADWAIVAASVVSDILCLKAHKSSTTPDAGVKSYFKGIRFSYFDLLCNCKDCHNWKGNGCYGGDIEKAIKYMADVGVVGGSNNGYSGAVPSVPADRVAPKLKNCLNYHKKPCSLNPVAGKGKYTKCEVADFVEFDPATQCTDKCNAFERTDKLVKDFKAPKELVKDVYTTTNYLSSTLDKHPMAVYMQIYEDLFLNDGESVYIHQTGRSLGTFVVKVIGKGTHSTSGLEYWLIKTTFGKDIGKDGKIMVLKRDGHCDIGSFGVYANVVDNLKKK